MGFINQLIAESQQKMHKKQLSGPHRSHAIGEAEKLAYQWGRVIGTLLKLSKFHSVER